MRRLFNAIPDWLLGLAIAVVVVSWTPAVIIAETRSPSTMRSVALVALAIPGLLDLAFLLALALAGLYLAWDSLRGGDGRREWRELVKWSESGGAVLFHRIWGGHTLIPADELDGREIRETWHSEHRGIVRELVPLEPVRELVLISDEAEL